MKRLRHWVFWPTFTLLVVALGFSMFNDHAVLKVQHNEAAPKELFVAQAELKDSFRLQGGDLLQLHYASNSRSPENRLQLQVDDSLVWQDTLPRSGSHFSFTCPEEAAACSCLLVLQDSKGDGWDNSFIHWMKRLNDGLLGNFGWLFSITSLLMVFICLFVFISPLGKTRIGGPDAKPLLTRWRWFSITLCTTIATGILFWGTAEPMYHFQTLPSSAGVKPETAEAAQFAMSTMFLHWGFTPYAIYALPTIAFALAFYNRKAPFSLASMFFPFYKNYNKGKINPPRRLSSLVDTLCLFALVAGMAASLGAGILTLAGGMDQLFGINKNGWVLLIICLVTVLAFIISASTGLMKGIRILSTWNVYGFMLIALFIFAFGPIGKVLWLAGQGLTDYFGSFFEKSLLNIVHPEDSGWANGWTVFYWANWMAWAPITAMFLGRIAKGYTIREVLLFNWIIPAFFAIIWMSIFSGTSLVFEMEGTAALADGLANEGAESVIYNIMQEYKGALIVSAIFVLIVFLSYVTAADSNTEAMGGISVTQISAEAASPPVPVKVVWGILIGATAYIMVSAAGIDGIKMLSNLGGFPALLLLIFTAGGVIWLVVRSFQGERLDEG